MWFFVKDVLPDSHGYSVVWVLKPEKNDYSSDYSSTTPYSNGNTKIFRPKIISRRISAQLGVFTVHKIILDCLVFKFETNKNFKDKLIKIKIANIHCRQIRDSLHIMGINSSTVFPDLDGLCAHLVWRFTYTREEVGSNFKL